jgi:signal transduction histidine kinase
VAKLRAQNKSISLMSSTVSHEMLTPLRCIIQMIDRLMGSLSDVKQSKNTLRTIQDTCQMILGQIKVNLDVNLVDMQMF